jgi:hypothetical protein
MDICFEKLPQTVEDLQDYPLDRPQETAALLVAVLGAYDPAAPDRFHEMLQHLLGGEGLQPLSSMTRSFIKDRMLQNGKYAFIGQSYMKGATPQNEYTPQLPLVVRVTEDPGGAGADPNLVRLGLQSGGADAVRYVQCRKTKAGRWVIWSDSFMSLLADIRKPESQNPWA